MESLHGIQLAERARSKHSAISAKREPNLLSVSCGPDFYTPFVNIGLGAQSSRAQTFVKWTYLTHTIGPLWCKVNCFIVSNRWSCAFICSAACGVAAPCFPVGFTGSPTLTCGGLFILSVFLDPYEFPGVPPPTSPLRKPSAATIAPRPGHRKRCASWQTGCAKKSVTYLFTKR